MALQLIKFVAPVFLFLTPNPTFAQHHGGGHGGHTGGHVGGYHGGYHGGHHGGYHSGYYGGYRGGYGYGGYGGYGGFGGFGYPFLGGYGLGYGLGYGGLGYGGLGYGLGYGRLGSGRYGGYGYSSPYYSSGYYSPYIGSSYYYPTAPVVIDGGVIPASGTGSTIVPSPSTVAAAAQVTVIVPEGAQVWFDGKEAPPTGTNRVFTSPVLQPGQQSMLSVKARWDGSNREMQLPIQAGDKMTVDLR